MGIALRSKGLVGIVALAFSGSVLLGACDPETRTCDSLRSEQRHLQAGLAEHQEERARLVAEHGERSAAVKRIDAVIYVDAGLIEANESTQRLIGCDTVEP